MAPKYVACTAALLVSGVSAFVAPTPMLRNAVASTRQATAPMRMSVGDEEPWFSEAVAVNLVDVEELT